MLLLFFGPSCSGKLSVAQIIADKIGAKIWTGKDCLKLAKNEREAWKLFKGKLEEASKICELTENSMVYIINDASKVKSHICRCQNLIRVKFTANLETLKQRFASRIKASVLPPPMVNMLELQTQKIIKHECDMEFDTSNFDPGKIAETIIKFVAEEMPISR